MNFFFFYLHNPMFYIIFKNLFFIDPPLHMPMVQGPVKSVKPKKPSKKALAAAEADPVISDEGGLHQTTSLK